MRAASLKFRSSPVIELGIGGETEASTLEEIDTSHQNRAIDAGCQFNGTGVERLMIQSERIPEKTTPDVRMKFKRLSKSCRWSALRLGRLNQKGYWRIRESRSDANLFIDDCEAAKLACLRHGV